MHRFFKSLAIAIFAIWLVGGIQYYRTINAYPKIATVESDAIVVLTGGSGRLSSGATLFLKNEAAHLFVTGVNAVTTKKDLKHLIDLNNNQINSSVTLGYEAQDTEGNAKETKQWVLQNKLTSIALVTAHYHMPRAMVEFNNILKGVKVIPVAVTPDLFRTKGQLNKKLQVLFFEYNKFLLATLKSFAMS